MLKKSIEFFEGRLLGQLANSAKNRRGLSTSLIEIIDQAAIWNDPFQDLAPTIADVDFETLMMRYPSLGCSAAAEVGFRFEGVGTVFWARFEELIGKLIPVGHRHLLAEAFVQLADRYPIERPTESGFNDHFSIIAWPIANALMPVEIANPLARLLARGPAWTGSLTGRHSDLSALRAWAKAWEGGRLADWLNNEAQASRVVSALLSDNSKSSLNAASFRRVSMTYAAESGAYLALRGARRRRRPDPARAPVSLEEGILSLRRQSGHFVLSVVWPPLPSSVLETARSDASGLGWRPRLWGQGSPMHSDQALGSLPVLLSLNQLPEGTTTAFPSAREVFGAESPTAVAALSRVVDWASPMLFLLDPANDVAERTVVPIRRTEGEAWLLSPLVAGATLPIIGEVAGCPIRKADLARAEDREILLALGLLHGEISSSTGRRLARHPIDAMALRKGEVRAESPFCSFDRASLTISRLSRDEIRPMNDVEGIGKLEAVTVTADVDPLAPDVFVFERQAAFDMLLEKRLLVRIESGLGAAEWPVEAMILCDGEILAFARDFVKQDGHSLASTGRLLGALQAEHVRKRILETGTGILRLRVGNQPWEIVTLSRADGEVDWDNLSPIKTVASAVGIVSAPAPNAHHFNPVSVIALPAVGASAYAIKLTDGRLASPALILANDRFELGDLSTNFSDLSGSRQLHADGRGVLDLAWTRRAWASSMCRSVASVAARLRVVRQFEWPLVNALCGREWAKFEREGAFDVDLRGALFNAILSSGSIELPEDFSTDDIKLASQSFAAFFAEACPMWPETDMDEEAADMALNSALEATLGSAHAEGRHQLIDADDFDFGAPSETWRAASERAQSAAFGSPLLGLIAPSRGAEILARRPFVTVDLAETSTFLADWSTAWCLPRGQVSKDLACSCLQVWLSPGTDTDAAVRQMARDAFLARAVRYVALRMVA